MTLFIRIIFFALFFLPFFFYLGCSSISDECSVFCMRDYAEKSDRMRK